MEGIKAGVVVVTKFCQSGSSTFSSYIDYIDRDEAVRTENSSKYNLYQDYMGNPEKTTGLFTEQKDITSAADKQNLKRIFQTAQEKGSLMWQTVISFDNRWLENNGLYRAADGMLDEERLKGITKSAVHKMLEKEGLGNAVWSAAIHYNTDNIHIHIATVEPEPMREKKEYIQYDYKEKNGRIVKSPRLDNHGQPITKSEYKGTFKQSSIETCKREMVNQIINEKENNLKINSIIRDSIVKQKREHPLSKDKELTHMFLKLYQHMPDCNRNMWNYNNPIIHSLHSEIDAISDAYLMKYHGAELEELKQRLQIQNQKYEESYGETNRNYADGKIQDLYSRLGNAVIKEIRDFDKKNKQGSVEKNLNQIEQDFVDLPDNKQDFNLRDYLGVTNDLQTLDKRIDQEDCLCEQDVTYPLEEIELNKVEWSGPYKRAKYFIHKRPPEYEQAIRLLEKECQNGNILAAYELGDVYRYGRGREIDVECAEKYYKMSFQGFYQMYCDGQERFSRVSENYLAYRLGKMHYYGLGTEQNYEDAKMYFESSQNQYAKYMLGKMAYNGQGTEQDYAKAYQCFNEISEQNAYAAYQAASMIDNKKVNDSTSVMEHLYRMAFDGFMDMEAKQEDDNLEYRIGCMYLNGMGTEQNEEKAEEFLSKSAEAGNIYAKNKLAMFYLKQERQDKLPEIIETLTEVSEKTENNWSMYALGNIYASNEYGMRDLKQAEEWYLRAEGEGNEFISYKLGKLYMDKESELYNLNQAVVHMEKALEKGNALAGYQLGKIYFDKNTEKYDFNKAVLYFQKAAQQDNALAAYQLGKIYMSREHGVYDISKAITFFQQAAEENQEYASYQLGNIYYQEDYGVKDDVKAYYWFAQSEENGNIYASYKLGKIDYNRKDYQKAVIHFSKCNDRYSHYYLGKMYLDPDGNIFDPQRGINYMEKSAEAENSFAELNLGILYLKGDVVPRDIKESKEWLTKAAEHGNGFADEIIKNMENRNWYHAKQHIRTGVSLHTAINKMKRGLKSEWEKTRLQREHDRMIEQTIDN